MEVVQRHYINYIVELLNRECDAHMMMNAVCSFVIGNFKCQFLWPLLNSIILGQVSTLVIKKLLS